jgi:hypothetical protein
MDVAGLNIIFLLYDNNLCFLPLTFLLVLHYNGWTFGLGAHLESLKQCFLLLSWQQEEVTI